MKDWLAVDWPSEMSEVEVGRYDGCCWVAAAVCVSLITLYVTTLLASQDL
jgi:hypothetical protein